MNKKRVLVAMSGGVDSSVSAYLLKKEGFDVIGITMHLWEDDLHKEFLNSCCSISSVYDAKAVADKIGIPHYTLNMKKIFKEKIVDNFINEYSSGRTPNPCVRCNKFVKFDALIKKADELDAHYIATGHYARIEKRNHGFELLKGIDLKKDQSYFLYVLKRDLLERIIFPLGNMTKVKTRKIAKELGLSVAEKKESQEICFIPDNNPGEFVRRYTSTKIKDGPILDLNGKILGRHRGIIYYTIGQRRGLNIGGDGPYYVVSIDKENNAIIVGKKKDLYHSELVANDVNIISQDFKNRVKAKIRYNANEEDAVIEPISDSIYSVKFLKPVLSITPGQSVVFYDGDRVLGGGVILKRK